MYILNGKSGSIAFYFIENKQYTIGRKGCNFLIADDKSISKNHATLTLEGRILKIIDVGCKYGTYINDVKLEFNKLTILKVGDIVRFGILESYYEVQERKLTVICSGLTTTNKNKLKQQLNNLNAKMLLNWSTDLSHITVDKILLTVKVLHALLENVPIVSLSFWEDFVKCTKNNLPPPIESKYIPDASELMHKSLSFENNPHRKTLFEDKVFVFKKKSNLEEIIVSASGKCIVYTDENITKNKLIGDKPQYIIIQEEQPSPDLSHPFNKLIASLKEIKKRAIPQPEIALAIVMCSCQTNCNPDFDRVGHLLKQSSQKVLPSQPLVAETAPLVGKTQHSIAESEIIIPQSWNSNATIALNTTKNVANTQDLSTVVIDDDDDHEVKEIDCVKPVAKRLAEDNVLTHEVKRLKVDSEIPSTSLLNTRPSTSKVTTSKMTDFFKVTAKESQEIEEVDFVKPVVAKKEVRDVSTAAKHRAEENTLSEVKKSEVQKRNTSLFITKPSTSKAENTKVDFFTSTPRELQSNTALDWPVSQVPKRKSSVNEKPETGKRLKIMTNPFSSSKAETKFPPNKPPLSMDKQKSTKRVIEIEDNEVEQVSKVNRSSSKHDSSSKVTTVVNNQLRDAANMNNIPQKSVARVPLKKGVWRYPNEPLDVQVIQKENDSVGAFLESFRNCVIVQKAQMVIEKDYKALGYDLDETTGKPKNFKRFKKVKRPPQTTIFTSFTKVVCGTK